MTIHIISRSKRVNTELDGIFPSARNDAFSGFLIKYDSQTVCNYSAFIDSEALNRINAQEKSSHIKSDSLQPYIAQLELSNNQQYERVSITGHISFTNQSQT